MQHSFRIRWFTWFWDISSPEEKKLLADAGVCWWVQVVVCELNTCSETWQNWRVRVVWLRPSPLGGQLQSGCLSQYWPHIKGQDVQRNHRVTTLKNEALSCFFAEPWNLARSVFRCVRSPDLALPCFLFWIFSRLKFISRLCQQRKI